ncbi:MBL fold metallo-hydrolase [Polaribacter sp. Asnod1-A03]|uniref:MBL fold metallo-hydrolase n=1 Tax=Polaribacter sp. Asnod1-A03 TaxID=3160581 RepID=UPI00386535CC
MKINNKTSKTSSILKSFFLLIFVFNFSQNSKAQELKLKYFGGAGWEMTEGDLNILVDPYISRLKLGDSPSNSKDDTRKNYYPSDIYVSDTVTINKILTKKVDFILVHHSHLDHLADVPYIAKKTGAMVIATETSCKILKAYGIPEKQLLRVRGGEDYQFEEFSVRVIPSIHSALNDKHYYDSRMHTDEIELPLKLEDFIEGKSLMFLIRFKNHKVLTAGSMNFLEREVDGLKPDIILPGVNFSRLEIYKYTERLMKLTNFPKIVIPTHWDNFRVPYGFSQESAIEKKINPFLEEVKLASPKSKVIVPVHLETITIK